MPKSPVTSGATSWHIVLRAASISQATSMNVCFGNPLTFLLRILPTATSLQPTSMKLRIQPSIDGKQACGLRHRRRKGDQSELFSQPCHPSVKSNHQAATRMNPRFFLRRHPQENRENVEKSEISKPKNESFQEKLTFGILKTFARNAAVTGLQPDEKRGQRKSVPFVNGGKANYEQTASSHR